MAICILLHNGLTLGLAHLSSVFFVTPPVPPSFPRCSEPPMDQRGHLLHWEVWASSWSSWCSLLLPFFSLLRPGFLGLCLHLLAQSWCTGVGMTPACLWTGRGRAPSVQGRASRGRKGFPAQKAAALSQAGLGMFVHRVENPSVCQLPGTSPTFVIIDQSYRLVPSNSCPLWLTWWPLHCVRLRGRDSPAPSVLSPWRLLVTISSCGALRLPYELASSERPSPRPRPASQLPALPLSHCFFPTCVSSSVPGLVPSCLPPLFSHAASLFISAIMPLSVSL